jgi:hypothetical protein
MHHDLLFSLHQAHDESCPNFCIKDLSQTDIS